MNNIQELISQKNGRLATLFACLEEITDPRINRRLEHPLITVIMIAICAHIGGANNWVEVEDFGKNHVDWFATFLNISNGIPSHDTFNRVFSILDHFELKFWLLLWLEDVICKSGTQITIDGKVIKAWASKDPLTIVRAWSAASKIVIDQVRVSPEHNEITAIKKLFTTLDLKGKVVTIDAIGTQRKIVATIVEKNGDYVLPVKTNHSNLHADISMFMDSLMNDEFNNVSYDYCRTVDNDHGRFEIRRCYTTDYIDWLPQKNNWKNLKSISVVELYSERKGKASLNKRYFISSLPPKADVILSTVRNHWSIENQLHYSLDVNFLEDRSTIRKGFGPQNFSLLRSFVASLLCNAPSTGSIKTKRTRANCNFAFLLAILVNKGF
jgi:predicted transposase YbfD/YdcC